ncbi:glycosyltransferase [Enterococcus saccharolyticus]|uniref:glycosyltransferase family 2 protein n=1 Tax=Enterococcus saccharolyticus TaxID=41997 RepID=UPI001E4B3E32|nr:glycosyltransferase family 2 protein [Enterococcus saccharolyticus]MCD5002545.1 glycosyltransferase [Enterococcus saccharolyticus]
MIEKKAEGIVAKPPDTEKKSTIKKYRNQIWILVTIFLNFIYLYWRIRYTLPFGYGVISLTIGIALIIVEVMGAIESLVHYYNMNKIENPPLPEVPLEMFPDVDVYIATYTEPLDLLYKTINACNHLEYPDKSKIHIYLCDDGRRPEARELAESMGITYLDRPDNKGAKAGNLNHAMSKSSSPLILTLDADMIPRRILLMRMVPYFVDAWIKNQSREEKDQIKMGFIQSPQTFYNPDLFQYFLYSENRIPNEQDYFYKDIQVARNRSNSVIYGGSNTLISREALESIGGFYEDAITEDFATGMLLQKADYRCYAINEELASGLSPTDFPNLIQQRIRWARGCIQTGRKMHILLTKGLSIAQKANYWASVWYWYAPIKRLIYIMSPIMFATFGFMVIKTDLKQILIFWLPMYISSTISLRMMSQEIRTTKWTNIYETAMFPFMLFPVLKEFFGISLKKFKVTNKSGVDTDRTGNLLYGLPFMLFILLSVIGVFNIIYMILASGSMGPIVILFWLIVNLFNLVMAMFFVMGRRYHRTSERVVLSEPAVIYTKYQGQFTCQTMDMSEGGLALFLEEAIFIDDEHEVKIAVTTDTYHAEVQAKVAHIDELTDGWKYAFRITDFNESKDEYMQILYDRVHTLPKSLHASHSTFDDLRLNIVRRTQPVVYFNRKSPRIMMDEYLQLSTGGTIHVINFNFQYFVTDSEQLDEYFTCELPNGVTLTCEFIKQLRNGSSLCRVTNIEEIYQDATQMKLLTEWANQSKVQLQKEEVVDDTNNLVNDVLGGYDEK